VRLRFYPRTRPKTAGYLGIPAAYIGPDAEVVAPDCCRDSIIGALRDASSECKNLFMTLTVQAAAKTDVGVVRKNNEDNFGYDVRHGIFVVCDGMGGQAAGEIASKIAVDTVLEYFRRSGQDARSPVVGRTFEGVSSRAASLANAIQLANLAIQEAASASSERAGMGSTIVAVRVEGNLFSVGHVGDSRVYLIRGGTIQPLTSDHSLVMEQVRRGLITVEEAETSKLQNVIVRALGSEESVEPDLADHELIIGDVLLLCCDGMSRFVTEAVMLERFGRATTLEQACEDLIQAAKDGGSDDNITCLLVRAVEQSWRERMADRLNPGKRSDGLQRST
jgi:serine/threonine protein phosphatase PrpC